MRRAFILFSVMVLCVASLFAQAPEKFSYQAVVRNGNNQLVTNAPVNVRLSILQGNADGEALYVETSSVVTNANGLMTVEIGGGKAQQGTFEDINWAQGPFFLKTETDPKGGEDYSVTSVQQLLSVPYALYAKEAGNSFSGDYNDLKNKPQIPQNVGELTNDAGYITLKDLPESSKGGETNDAGIVQTTACGEIDLCELVNRVAQMEAALLPTVTTVMVSSITENTAICGGTVTANGYSAVTARGVCWATVPNPTVGDSHTSNGTGTGTFSSTLMGLSPNTTYYVRAYATNSVGTAYGEEVSFITAEAQQDTCTIDTLPYFEDFENYTTSTATETGVQPGCWEVITEDVTLTNATKPQVYCGFATSGSYSLRLKNRCIYAMPALSNDISIRNLTMTFNLRQAKTVYRLQVGVVNDAGEFTLVQTIKCSTTGVEAKTVNFSDYTGNGRRIAFRNTVVSGSTIDYSTNFIDDIVLADNVSATLPTVTTVSISEITATTAIGNGELTADGGSSVTECGFCWGENANPTIAGSHIAADTAAIGTYTVNINGLTPSTTYYVRAYATNSVGTAYGDEVSFTTSEIPQDTCSTITLPYSENFDEYTTSTTASTGVEPTCWQLVQADVAMTDAARPQLYYKSSYAHSGNYSLRMGNRGVYAMPALSENVQLKHVHLEMYLRQTSASYQLQVGVWEDNGIFVPIDTFNNSTTSTQQVECDFSEYTGSGRRIAFRNLNSSGNNYSYNYIDDITLEVLMPQGYYDAAVNKSGNTLRVALHNIIKEHDTLSYNDLWQAFYTTDMRTDTDKIWDIYSDRPGSFPYYYFSFGSSQCGSYSDEGDCYNREHSVPNSWFGGSVAPMYTDLFHLYPTDGYVNSKRGNLPIGKVTNATWTSTNGSKVGTSNISGYSGQVFEPIDSFKGDFARTYFYMAVCYMDKNLGVETQSNFSGGDLKPWAKQLLLQWAALDPVSQKEMDRNNAVYQLQHNRNPFIDHPELAEKIFGSDTTPFLLTNP